jgi:hypothetical protein
MKKSRAQTFKSVNLISAFSEVKFRARFKYRAPCLKKVYENVEGRLSNKVYQTGNMIADEIVIRENLDYFGDNSPVVTL